MKKTRVSVPLLLWKKGLASLAVLGLLGWGGSALGGTGMTIATTNTTIDEFGVPLVGSWGDDPSNCDLVIIYWASNGIYVPQYDGNPDPRNPPFINCGFNDTGVWRIGVMGSGAVDEPPGLFGAGLGGTNRPPVSSKLFVREFNAPTLEAASFYGDSAVFEVTGDSYNGKEQIVLIIDKTRYPFDIRDNDGDGLNNSWEDSLGSDPNNPHSDEDGVNDLDEWIAGSDATNSNSFFIMARIRPGPGDEHNTIVGWPSMAGKKYILQYTPELSDTNPAFEFKDVSAELTATSDFTEVTVTNGGGSGRGHFRARATTPPPPLDPHNP